MEKRYPHLLSPIRVGSHLLKNRMVSTPSGMHMNRGSEPFPTQTLFAYYEGKARNGAAVSVVNGGTMYVEWENPGGFTNDYDVRSMWNRMPIAELVNGIHMYGGLAEVNLHLEMPYGYDISGGLPISHLGPPPAGAEPNLRITKEAPVEMLEKVAEDYTDLIAKLKTDCGFDGVHVYMPYQALTMGRCFSPLTNLRTDKYGGTLEKRMAYPMLILELIRKKCGKDFLVEANISYQDPPEIPGGYTMADCVEYMKLLAPYVDYFMLKPPYKDPSHPVQFHGKTPWLEDVTKMRELCGRIRPIEAVGGFTHPDLAEKALAEDKVDIIGMGRAWISNPDYVRLMAEDRAEDITPCLRCNKCHRSSWSDPLIPVCSVNPLYGIEHKAERLVKPPLRRKKLAVAGGGPAGMRTAMYLADRGHDVTLFEETDALGGQLRVTEDVDFKWTLRDYKNWLIAQVGKRPIRVRLNTRATAELLDAEGYEEIFVCVGGRPRIPDLPGASGANVMTAWRAFKEPEKLGKNVVIVGGGEVGTEAGIFLARQGHEVTVMCRRARLAEDSTPIHYWEMFREEWEKTEGFHGMCGVSVTAIEDGGIRYTDRDGTEGFLPCDSVVLATGTEPRQDDAMVVQVPGVVCHLIGDCWQAGNIQKLNRTAFATTASV